MPSNIPPGSTVIGRMGIYRRLVEIPALKGSYARKFAVAAFVSAQTPLVVFIVYLLVARADDRGLAGAVDPSRPNGRCVLRHHVAPNGRFSRCVRRRDRLPLPLPIWTPRRRRC